MALQATYSGEVDDGRQILIELARTCRDGGMVGWLPVVGSSLGTVEMLLGHFHEADAALSESLRTAQEVDQPNRVSQARSVLAVLAAIRGDEPQCRELAQRCLRHFSTDFNALEITHAEWALGLLDLAYGRYEAAIDRFEALYESPYRALGQWIHLMSDRVEAAVRLRSPERAIEPMTVLEQWSAATGSRWIEAHLLRCRGMLDGDGESFARALDLHAAERRWFDHSRTGLLYGEWLRRERSKTMARSVLRDALRTFERLDARPWAERARVELRAVGVAARGRTRSDLAEHSRRRSCKLCDWRRGRDEQRDRQPTAAESQNRGTPSLSSVSEAGCHQSASAGARRFVQRRGSGELIRTTYTDIGNLSDTAGQVPAVTSSAG